MAIVEIHAVVSQKTICITSLITLDWRKKMVDHVKVGDNILIYNERSVTDIYISIILNTCVF